MKPELTFHQANEYAFFFEQNQLLLLDFNRDDKRDLFLIQDQTERGLILEYPGALFTEQILDVVGQIFFLQVRDEENEQETRYALGAYFTHDDRGYGAYYPIGSEAMELVLFGIEEQAGTYTVQSLEEQESLVAKQQFATLYEGMFSVGTESP